MFGTCSLRKPQRECLLRGVQRRSSHTWDGVFPGGLPAIVASVGGLANTINVTSLVNVWEKKLASFDFPIEQVAQRRIDLRTGGGEPN